MTVPPSGTTHPEMVEYARTSITTTLPDIHAHFTQTWRPQPITIKDMARRLANRWFKVVSEQTSAQHNASTQQDHLDQHGASTSDTNQQHPSVQLTLPALQVSTTPARSETPLSSKGPLSSPANLKQEEAAPENLKQEEESK